MVEKNGKRKLSFPVMAHFCRSRQIRFNPKKAKIQRGCVDIADLKEVEERPKLGHVVLEGCSRQQQPVSRSELLHLLEEPGFGVFQTVALVHDDVAPLAGLEGQQVESKFKDLITGKGIK